MTLLDHDTFLAYSRVKDISFLHMNGDRNGLHDIIQLGNDTFEFEIA